MAGQGYSLFGQRLVERGVITQEQLNEAVHRQQTTMSNRKLGEILVRLGYIAKSHITEGLADQLNLPVVQISSREIPERIRGMIDMNIATIYRVIPLQEEGQTLVIATADPTNINRLDDLQRLLDRPVRPELSTPEEISHALAKYYDLQEATVEKMLSSVSSSSSMSTLSTMSNMGGSSVAGSLSSAAGSLSMDDMSLDSMSIGQMDMDSGGASGIPGLDEDEDDSPVVRYVFNVIMDAFRLRASDIHFEPGKRDVKLRYRVDGVMQEMPVPPKRAQAAIISRLKILANMDISERRVPQDGRIKINLAGKMVDLRVSALPASYGESIVMRILDKSGLMLGLGQLGFVPEDQRTWERLLSHSTGVVLVTGPTGSGKTTTLYASLHTLNKPDVKLITVEDPVEYQLSGINQVQIHHEIGWTFARALRAIFRQDPDIVMVGEIRDLETAEIAVKAALTGHLVFSTLHTNDAASAFIRMIDLGLKPFLVASGVRAILGQRLVRVICPTCKETYKPTEEEVGRLGIPGVDFSKIDLFRGAGCDSCNHTGYTGRLGCYELLENTDDLRKMLLAHSSAIELRRAARRAGMVTMREDAWRKALQGITTIEEVNKRTKVDEPINRNTSAPHESPARAGAATSA